MGYVKVVKTSAYFSRYQVKYKRRWESPQLDVYAMQSCARSDGRLQRPC